METQPGHSSTPFDGEGYLRKRKRRETIIVLSLVGAFCLLWLMLGSYSLALAWTFAAFAAFLGAIVLSNRWGWLWAR